MHSPVRVHIRGAGQVSAASTKASSLVKSKPFAIFGICFMSNPPSLAADEEVEFFGTKTSL